MELEAPSCPRCGGPLAIGAGVTAVICHYCNFALRVRPGAAQSAAAAASSAPEPPVVTIDASISSDTVVRIKQLLLAGKRDEAVALYEGEARCNRTAAQATIEQYVKDVVTDTTPWVRMSARGMSFYAGALLLLGGGIALGATGRLDWEYAAVVAAPGIVLALLLSPGFLLTMRYLFATSGVATVVRFALIGNCGYEADSLFRLLLDVREPSGSTFRAEIPIVLGKAHAKAVKEGHRIRVKYFPGRPATVVYDGELTGGEAVPR